MSITYPSCSVDVAPLHPPHMLMFECSYAMIRQSDWRLGGSRFLDRVSEDAAYAAADLAEVCTEEIVFRIWEAIW